MTQHLAFDDMTCQSVVTDAESNIHKVTMDWGPGWKIEIHDRTSQSWHVNLGGVLLFWMPQCLGNNSVLSNFLCTHDSDASPLAGSLSDIAQSDTTKLNQTQQSACPERATGYGCTPPQAQQAQKYLYLVQ